jgi:hypothetical protein
MMAQVLRLLLMPAELQAAVALLGMPDNICMVCCTAAAVALLCSSVVQGVLGR